jgi:hypothetical protein
MSMPGERRANERAVDEFVMFPLIFRLVPIPHTVAALLGRRFRDPGSGTFP